MTASKSQFRPDYSQRPGEYLAEILDDRGIGKTEFAVRCGRPAKTISEIINGKAAIIPDTALQFERVLDVNAQIWMSRESDYQLFKAREREREGLTKQRAWATKFPVAEMQRRGYIPKVEDGVELITNLLTFFGVSSVDAFDEYWQTRVTAARFKKMGRHSYDGFAVAAWLQRGDAEASEIECAPFSEAKLKGALERIRRLTLKRWPSFRQELVTILSSCGVSIAFVPALHKLNLRGAAYWATKDRAVIILSDRLKREHKFWFALAHEIMHILLHSKKALFLEFDSKRGEELPDEEREADEGAANFLIPAAVFRDFKNRYALRLHSDAETTIRSFAKEIGVSPAIVLIRLQREELFTYKTVLNKVFDDTFSF